MAAALGDAGPFARAYRASFFVKLQSLFGGRFTQAQVYGSGWLLDAFLPGALILDWRHLAYILATSFRETSRRMQAQ